MNTTIIRADAATRLEVMQVVRRKLNTPSRPVLTFRNGEDTMVISGCTMTCFFSALSARLGKRIELVEVR